MPRLSLADRFWRKVDKSGGPDGCWPWTGFIYKNGYGYFRIGTGKNGLAHRIAFILTHGPTDSDVDHDCHNQSNCPGGWTCPHRRCCNPEHLVSSTRGENLANSPHGHANVTHCPSDHPYDEANTYVTPEGYRKCRRCNADRARALRQNRTEQKQKGSGSNY